MRSISIAIKSKNRLIELFETLAQFPNMAMQVKCGDYTVDAHSLMGVFAIDITKPIELILDTEPNAEFKEAISKFSPQIA